jgi:hypothetical protein
MGKSSFNLNNYIKAVKVAVEVALISVGEEGADILRQSTAEEDIDASFNLSKSFTWAMTNKQGDILNLDEVDDLLKPNTKYAVNIGTGCTYARDVDEGYAGGHVEYNPKRMDESTGYS